MKELATRDDDGGVLAAILSDPERLKSIPIETVERLYQMHLDVQQRAADAALSAALAELHSKIPVIPHDQTATIVSRRTGTTWSYTFASRPAIQRALQPFMGELGLSYTFDQETDGKTITAICTVRHKGGGKHVARFAAPIDGGDILSGAQYLEKAETTAQRRALSSAFGLATEKYAGDTPPTMRGDEPRISAQQAADLLALMSEVGADPERFLAWLNVSDLESLPASRYAVAVQALESKRRAAL